MTEIRLLDDSQQKNEAAHLLRDRNIEGYSKGHFFVKDPINLGIFEEDKLVSCLAYGVFDKGIGPEWNKEQIDLPYMYLEFAATDKKHEGKGYATELINAAIRDSTINSEVKQIYADCVYGSQNMLVNQGFEIIKSSKPREKSLIDRFFPLYAKYYDAYYTSYCAFRSVPEKADYFIIPGDLEQRTQFWEDQKIKKMNEPARGKLDFIRHPLRKIRSGPARIFIEWNSLKTNSVHFEP